MYVGKKSLSHLATFVRGAQYATVMNTKDDNQTQKEYDFQRWLQNYYQVSTSLGWEKLILANTEDEQYALEQFWELLETFKKEVVEKSED